MQWLVILYHVVTVYFRLFKQNYSLFSLVIFLQSSGVTVNSHNLVIINESCSTMTSGEGYLLKIQNLFPVEGTNIQNKRTKTCKRSILQLVASGSRQFSFLRAFGGRSLLHGVTDLSRVVYSCDHLLLKSHQRTSVCVAFGLDVC